MIPQGVSSFFENAKDKFTNPFFGTLMLVWLYRNWEIVFSLFNFDKKYTLEMKLNHIKNYYKNTDMPAFMVNNILYALGLMLLGYVLVVLTRVLVNVVEHRLMPNLNSRTVSKLVADRKDYDDVRKQRDDYAEKYELEKNKTRSMIAETDGLRGDYDREITELKVRLKTMATSDEENKKMFDELQIKAQKSESDLAATVTQLNAVKKMVEHKEKRATALEESLQEADKKINYYKENYELLNGIILSDFDAYLLFQNEYTAQEEIENKVPEKLYKLYSNLAKDKLDNTYMHVAKLLENEEENTTIHSKFIEGLVAHGIIETTAKKQPYYHKNTKMTELGNLMVRLEPVLRGKYDRQHSIRTVKV